MVDILLQFDWWFAFYINRLQNSRLIITFHSSFRCTKNMNNLVISLAPKFTKLQSLILRQDKPQLEDNAVETIANFCHDLQVLDLSKSFKLSDCSLYALAHGCPNLTKLNISGCSAFSDIALEYLASFCRKLKVLNLCGCVKTASDRALRVWVLSYFPLVFSLRWL